MAEALVIGAGPAGLMAADVLSGAGHAVTLADRMPSFGRKFLMAGKSGLNLTMDEDPARFLAAYPDCPAPVAQAVARFGPTEVMAWARGLGQPVFTGSSGRVFPEVMKASPLLRAWLERLAGQGATARRRWAWQGWDGREAIFETPEGIARLTPAVTVLALGGASWRRLGSDGAWAKTLGQEGAPITPFAPSNVGLSVSWSRHMERHFGTPIKPLTLVAGETRLRGECVISRTGLEGAGIYGVSRAIRLGAPLTLDLAPDQSAEALAARYAKRRRGDSLSSVLRKTLRLKPGAAALVREFGQGLDLPAAIKALPIPQDGLRPLDEAISTAGGLGFEGVGEDFMVTARPGVFAAGEMLDWDAPTGGYLITACLATGRAAGLGALRYLEGAAPG